MRRRRRSLQAVVPLAPAPGGGRARAQEACEGRKGSPRERGADPAAKGAGGSHGPSPPPSPSFLCPTPLRKLPSCFCSPSFAPFQLSSSFPLLHCSSFHCCVSWCLRFLSPPLSTLESHPLPFTSAALPVRFSPPACSPSLCLRSLSPAR